MPQEGGKAEQVGSVLREQDIHALIRPSAVNKRHPQMAARCWSSQLPAAAPHAAKAYCTSCTAGTRLQFTNLVASRPCIADRSLTCVAGASGGIRCGCSGGDCAGAIHAG